jgi:hypothetical protein
VKEITAYQCDHCAYTKPKRAAAKRHERTCYYNPATRSCATCGNFSVIYSEYDVYMGDGMVDQELCKERWCEAFEERLDRRRTKCVNWTAKAAEGGE